MASRIFVSQVVRQERLCERLRIAVLSTSSPDLGILAERAAVASQVRGEVPRFELFVFKQEPDMVAELMGDD